MSYLKIVNPPAPLRKEQAKGLLDDAFKGVRHEEILRRVQEGGVPTQAA